MISILKTGALALIPALFLAGSVRAQEEGEKADDPRMVERRDAKLKEPFLQNAEWVVSYDKAKAQAKKDGKLIFAYFTRSYAP